ncbi:MAG: DUF4126 family protein [Polyangiales bacterium]
MIYALALLVGIVAGLRAMTAPAAVSWAARLGWLKLGGTWLAFFGSVWATVIFTLLAVSELVTDQLPQTPSRKVPIQFGTRVVSGGLCGAAVGVAAGSWMIGLLLGAVGAIIGTVGGAAVRARLARTFGKDRPAAFIEDAVALVAAVIVVGAFA